MRSTRFEPRSALTYAARRDRAVERIYASRRFSLNVLAQSACSCVGGTFPPTGQTIPRAFAVLAYPRHLGTHSRYDCPDLAGPGRTAESGQPRPLLERHPRGVKAQGKHKSQIIECFRTARDDALERANAARRIHLYRGAPARVKSHRRETCAFPVPFAVTKHNPATAALFSGGFRFGVI